MEYADKQPYINSIFVQLENTHKEVVNQINIHELEQLPIKDLQFYSNNIDIFFKVHNLKNPTQLSDDEPTLKSLFTNTNILFIVFVVTLFVFLIAMSVHF